MQWGWQAHCWAGGMTCASGMWRGIWSLQAGAPECPHTHQRSSNSSQDMPAKQHNQGQAGEWVVSCNGSQASQERQPPPSFPLLPSGCEPPSPARLSTCW